MKQYIWLTISMILIMNMCKASQSTNETSEIFVQNEEKIAYLQQRLQTKYAALNIPPLTIVPNQNFTYAQLSQSIQPWKERSPFFEDILDDRLPLQSSDESTTTYPIILPESILSHSQEEIEKRILREMYFSNPSTMTTTDLCCAAIKTATTYTLIFANALRTPGTIFIPNAALAKTFKCLAVPMALSTKVLLHQDNEASNFIQKHYQPEPLTQRQQVIKDAHDEFQQLAPRTQQTLTQTHLSTNKILDFMQ